MAEYDAPQQDWLQPNDPFAAGMLPPRPVVLYDLRPLSTAEILDRTFTLYRSRFWLYTGIASITACLRVLSTAGYLSIVKTPMRPTPGVAASLIGVGVYLVSAILALVAYSITQAATTSAVSAAYLGQVTSIGTALRSVRGHWFRYVLIALWQTWSAIWIAVVLASVAGFVAVLEPGGFGWLVFLLFFLAFVSFIYGVIAYLRNSLAVPASVIENLPVRAAMRRSKNLTVETKGRIFLMLLLLGGLYLVAATLQTPFSFMLLLARSSVHIVAQAIMLVITFLTAALIGPVGAIALCLFYFDERVRKEAFDIEFLMDRAAPVFPNPSIPASAGTESA